MAGSSFKYYVLIGILCLSGFGTFRMLQSPGCPEQGAGSEAVLLKTYRRHLEEMRVSMQALRGQSKSAEDSQAGILEAEMVQLQGQLAAAQQLLQQQAAAMQQAQMQQQQVQQVLPQDALPRMSPSLARLPLPSDHEDWSLRPWRPPTYVELYEQLYAKPHTDETNVIMTFPNPYNKIPHMDYPHSSLWLEGDKIMDRIFKELGDHPLRFIVEAGSMHGGSAIRMAMELDKRSMTEVPILCIDPWSGDLNMWLNRIIWEHLDVRDGRATTFDQFMINVKKGITDGKISPHHIVPFPVSSIVGARWLQATGFQPSLIYLDSAHELDETYYELCLYWYLLEPGGILMGDDYGWMAVRMDVDRFVKDKNLQLNMFGVYYNWFVRKPKLGGILT